MSRDGHVQAVGFAGIKIEELENILGSVDEKMDEVLGVVALAVGDNPVNDSGRAALEHMKSAAKKLDDIAHHCNAAKAHLNDYGNVF